MELILNILFIIVLSITSSWFTKLIVYCFKDGNIFDWYYNYISKIMIKNPKLFKMLGGCYICFNIWISTLIFECFKYVIDINYILFIPFIGSSFIMSYIISKIENNNNNSTLIQPTTNYKKKAYISYIKTYKNK